MPVEEKTDKIGKNYAVEFFAGDIKLTNYVNRLRITNSIATKWPVVTLEADIGAAEIISEKIYGADDIRLEVIVTGSSNQELETNTYYLMYMQSNLSLVPKDSIEKIWEDRQPIIFTFAPIYAINVLGSFVNIVYDRDNPDSQIQPEDGTILSAFKNIYTNKLGFKQLNSDSTTRNLDAIDQFVIPPMSLRQCIEYLDSVYSFYKTGALFYYCDKDGQLNMWNLLNVIDRKPSFSVTLVSADNIDNQKLEKLLNDEVSKTEFYTYQPIQTIYSANGKVLANSHTICFVSHPDGTLYRFHCSDIDETNVKFPYHEKLKARKQYFTDSPTFNDYSIKNYVGQTFKNMLSIKVTIGGTLIMENLTKVGTAVELKPINILYFPYQGNYILGASDYVLDRKGANNWVGTCTLSLFRPQLEQTQPGIEVRSSQ